MDVPRRYLGGLQIFALLVVAASAQPADAPVRKIAFTVFATEPVEHVAYVPYPGATPVPLAFFPTARSPHYLHRGPETMHFYDSVPCSSLQRTMHRSQSDIGCKWWMKTWRGLRPAHCGF